MMKTLFYGLMVSLLIAGSAAAIPPPEKPTDKSTAGWLTYTNEKKEFSFKYPVWLKLIVDSGDHCVSEVCRPVESILLRYKVNSNPANPDVRFITLDLQRNINTKQLPINKFYQESTHQSLGSNATMTLIGGKQTLLLWPTGRGATKPGMVASDHYDYFIQINKTDMLSTHCGDSKSLFDQTCRKIVSTLVFTR